MRTIKSLPDLPLFGMWCRNPTTRHWTPGRMAHVVATNANRESAGLPPFETGEPAPGDTVWTGEDYAVYQP